MDKDQIRETIRQYDPIFRDAIYSLEFVSDEDKPFRRRQKIDSHINALNEMQANLRYFAYLEKADACINFLLKILEETKEYLGVDHPIKPRTYYVWIAGVAYYQVTGEQPKAHEDELPFLRFFREVCRHYRLNADVGYTAINNDLKDIKNRGWSFDEPFASRTIGTPVLNKW